jgi:hypothetical protein
LAELETRRNTLTAPTHGMDFNSLSIILSHLRYSGPVRDAHGIGMEAVGSKEGIHGVETGVAEESYPQVESPTSQYEAFS